jgi:hypothetical protein
MTDYGTMKVFMLYVNSHGQTQRRTIETRHYITLEEAKEYAGRIREDNNPEKIEVAWQPENIRL